MQLSDFPIRSYDKVRYGDCDPLGHVNNSVFATFMETGRCDLFAAVRWSGSGKFASSFVIARLELDYIAEILWPGQVEVGSAVLKIGNSSVHIEQILFQGEKLAAKAKSVLVHIGPDKRSLALSEDEKAGFTKLIRPCA